MSNNEESLWEHLASHRPTGEVILARLAFPEISNGVLAGIDHAGMKHFLIPISSNDDCSPDNMSRGLVISCENLKIRGSSGESSISRYIDVKCREEGATEVFDIVGRQIASALKTPNVSPSESVRSVLNRWRYFWGHTPADVLSREEIIGLFSELWFIYRWIVPFKPLTLLRGWKGPYGSRHDFEWEGVSVEVKGTTSVQGRRHRINGIEQLVPPEDGKLLLFSLKMREEGGGRYTLSSLVDLCLKEISENAEGLELLEGVLAVSGYSPAHQDEYEKLHFRVVDEILYEVGEHFPRIVPDSFVNGKPEGVDQLSYEINLDNCESSIISKAPKNNLF